MSSDHQPGERTAAVPALRQLAALEGIRGNHAVLYFGLMEDDAPQMLYEHLRTVGRLPRLDLVLGTQGGTPTVARRVALLLHEFTEHLAILVPHRARSAGTLLCLGAHELVLGPLAELGPLDPIICANGAVPDGPESISAQDIRAFRMVAEDWFGVDGADNRLQVFALLAQRFFPTSLASFYRTEKLTRQIGVDLLARQLPDAEEGVLDRIVDRLVSGFHAHDYPVTRAEARALGLRVVEAPPEVEALLWSLAQECREHALSSAGRGEELLGLMAGNDFRSRRVGRPTITSQGPTSGATSLSSPERDFHWNGR